MFFVPNKHKHTHIQAVFSLNFQKTYRTVSRF
jgi:hypothetical protein